MLVVTTVKSLCAAVTESSTFSQVVTEDCRSAYVAGLMVFQVLLLFALQMVSENIYLMVRVWVFTLNEYIIMY